MEEYKDIFGYQLNQQQYSQIFQNNEELCNFAELIQTEYNNKGVEYFQTIRNQMNSKIQNLYDVVKLDDYATKNIVNNQLRLAYYNVSREYPYMIQVRGDGNCFYRSLVVGILISISSHENSQYIRVLIRKLQILESLMYQLRDQSIDISERDVGLILARFFISILIAKNIHPNFNILQLLAEYNDFPEVDLSLNIFCRNIINEYFDKHLKDPQYNQFIGDDMKNNIPFYLCYIGQEAEDVIIPLSANAFSYNITIQNIFIDNQEKTYQDKVTYKPTVGEPLTDMILCYSSGHYNLLLDKEQSKLFQKYPPQVLLNSSSILKILKNERIIRYEGLKNNKVSPKKEVNDQNLSKDNTIREHIQEKQVNQQEDNSITNNSVHQIINNKSEHHVYINQSFITVKSNSVNGDSTISKPKRIYKKKNSLNIENKEIENEKQIQNESDNKTKKIIKKDSKEKSNLKKQQQLNNKTEQKLKVCCFECKKKVYNINEQIEGLALCNSCYQMQSKYFEKAKVQQFNSIELTLTCQLCQKKYNENEYFQSKTLCQQCVKINILSNFSSSECICCKQKAIYNISSLVYKELSVGICMDCVRENFISIKQDDTQYLKIYIKAVDVYTTFKMDPKLIQFTKGLNNINKAENKEDK